MATETPLSATEAIRSTLWSVETWVTHSEKHPGYVDQPHAALWEALHYAKDLENQIRRAYNAARPTPLQP